MMQAHEASWYAIAKQAHLCCQLCPRACLIPDGASGQCRIRKNSGGKLYSLSWGRFSALALDPVEKKPLYHFFPGARTLSLGTLGCNMHCLHCQNDSLSNPDAAALVQIGQTEIIYPKTIVSLAERHHLSLVVWTYNEPLINAEYLTEALPLVRKAGLATVLVTAGLISPAPLQKLLPHLDAWRIDLKGWGDDFYRRLTGYPGLKTVLENTLLAKKAGCHIEVVTNIIAGWNDSPESLTAIANWIVRELGDETPWHVTASYPAAQLTTIRPTPAATILRAQASGLEAGLKHVYCGNIALQGGSDTHCPACGTVLIRRHGFTVLENRVSQDATCPECGRKIMGRFD